MKEEQDYIRDIAEIRSMMERSTKFLSLSGWAGVMAGIYALAGVYIATDVLSFNPNDIFYSPAESSDLLKVIGLAIVVLILAVGTAVLLSYKRSNHSGEKVWSSTSRRLVASMAIPLFAGGILILILISKGLLGLVAPLSLLFYGLSLYNAGKFTFNEVKFLGMMQIGLGLISSYYIDYGMLFWAVGFGLLHIGYGIYLHFKYER